MSTCGMLIRRDILVDKLMLWPTELGVYSGGEHYINFAMAVLGMSKFVFNSKPLQHYAAPRGYALSWYDIYRNRAIATYLVGGDDLFYKFIHYHKFNLQGKVSPRSIIQIGKTIPSIPELIDIRRHIELNTVVSIQDWAKGWKDCS